MVIRPSEEIQIDVGKYIKEHIVVILLIAVIVILFIPKLPDVNIPRPFWTQATVIGIPECKVTCNCECFEQKEIEYELINWTWEGSENWFINNSYWDDWDDCPHCWRYYGGKIFVKK